jgi:demethylmenaquinone methyltransferase/2-methoxy-6-polyprenyl-1,4-benzoquinol methylase
MAQVNHPTPENRYYAPGEERADKVRLLFGRIARHYDRINDLMSLGLHRRWKRELVRRAGPLSGKTVLDLCCGTGDVTRIAAEAGPAAVVGLDFTEGMLEVARRTTPSGAPVTYRQGDALQLPFPDRSFDLVTVAYGLRNLADLDRGLREVCRVLRPGGRLASLEFGRPSNPLIRAGYFGYLRLALPLLGRIFFGDPHTYGYIFTTVSRFPGQHDLAERMRAAGFEKVEVQDRMAGTMGICVAHKATSPESKGAGA